MLSLKEKLKQLFKTLFIDILWQKIISVTLPKSELKDFIIRRHMLERHKIGEITHSNFSRRISAINSEDWWCRNIAHCAKSIIFWYKDSWNQGEQFELKPRQNATIRRHDDVTMTPQWRYNDVTNSYDDVIRTS